MKLNVKTVFAVLILAAGIVSCKKDPTTPAHTPVARKVKFVLYTTKDFSAENGNITFTLRISNGNAVIWDSVLAPMKIKDIPALANKKEFEKTVITNNNVTLATGFLYHIENVGISWHIEDFKAGETTKIVDYDFQ